MARWVPLCSDCWYDNFPGDYFPGSMTHTNCWRCGEPAMCAHVNPRDLDPDVTVTEDSPSLQDVTSDELLALDAEAFG